MPSRTLADSLPRQEKPDRRDIHTVSSDPNIVSNENQGGWACEALDCWFESRDLTDVAKHVVENQWQR